MNFRGEIWRDDGLIELYDFLAPSREKAIEFMEAVRKTDLKERGKARAVGVVLRRKFWFIPWFAFHIAFDAKYLKSKEGFDGKEKDLP